MTFRTHLAHAVLALVAAFALSLAGCSSAAAPAAPTAAARTTEVPGVAAATPPAAASDAATVAPVTGAASRVDADRAMVHVRALGSDIGIRAAGTAAERAAAQYIAGVLRDEGYATEIEPFTFGMRFDDSRVALSDGTAVDALLLDGSALGSASGALVAAGTGQPDEIAAANVRDRLVLVHRGVIPFSQKVANARAAGAVAVIIVNSEPGPLRGTLGTLRADIPVLGVDGRGGRTALEARLEQQVAVTADGGSRPVTSQNVVGRRGEDCRAYLGAHYDSVPQGPGANDNASGTATVLELGRVHAVDSLCIVAFGAEEVGLFGSQAFVAQHPVLGVRFMLNFDMAGRIDNPIIVGDDGLTAAILAILRRGADQVLRAGTFPPFASSDHVSFSAAGVPAVTITAGDDAAMHTPRDDVAHVQRDALATILGAGDAALTGLLKTMDARSR